MVLRPSEGTEATAARERGRVGTGRAPDVVFIESPVRGGASSEDSGACSGVISGANLRYVWQFPERVGPWLKQWNLGCAAKLNQP